MTFFSEPYGLAWNLDDFGTLHAGMKTLSLLLFLPRMIFLLIAGLFFIVGMVTIVIALSAIDVETPGNVGGFILLLMVPPEVGWIFLVFHVIFLYWQFSLIVMAGAVMVGVPILWFIKTLPHTLKKGVVVGYFVSFFALMAAIIVDIVDDLSAILGACVFLGTGMAGLTYLITRNWMKKRQEKRMKTLAL